MGELQSGPDESARSFVWRVERELSEEHAVLWTVVITASIFDVVTTMVGLMRGFDEGNAVAQAFIQTYGTPGIGLLKLSGLILLVVSWAVLPERPAGHVLLAFAFISLLTVALNTVTLAPV
jgi:hypothetical protein